MPIRYEIYINSNDLEFDGGGGGLVIEVCKLES